MAKIEIRSRDVKVFGVFGAQHLFIIFTNDNGDEFIIRGGPEKGHEFYDNLHIINSPYEKQFEHLFKGDFDPDDIAPRVEISNGTDEQVQSYMDKMIELAHLINVQKYDYKIPFGESVQNSNTIVNILVNAVGLTFSLPKDKENGKDVWAPGVYGNLEHTNIDQIIEFLLSPYGTLGFAIAMQILLDAQNRGFIISMQNVDFINYAQGRFQDLSSSSMKVSNSPSVSPAKGPMGNSPASTPSRGGSSPNPTKVPTSNPNKGPTGSSSATNRNNPPTVRTQASTNNQPSKASTNGAFKSVNTPTTSQRTSTNNLSTSPAKEPVNAPSSGSTRASSNSTNSNNATTIKSNPSGVPSSSRAPSASVPEKAPVIIPTPACSIAPTLVPGQNYNYQLATIEIRSRDYESLRT